MSRAMAAALTTIANAVEESLSYSVAHGSTFTALTGFVLDRDEPQVPSYDERQFAEATIRVGRLSGPLTPVMVVGGEIADGNGDIWAIETVDLDQQQLCAVRLTTIAEAGPNRGRTQ